MSGVLRNEEKFSRQQQEGQHLCGQHTQNSGRGRQDVADAEADGPAGSFHCEFIGGTVVPECETTSLMFA